MSSCMSCATWRHASRFGSAPSSTATRRTSTRRSEEHTSELQSPCNLVCRLLLEKKKKKRSTALNLTCIHLDPLLSRAYEFYPINLAPDTRHPHAVCRHGVGHHVSTASCPCGTRS